MDRNNRDVRAVVNDPIKPESRSMFRNEERARKKNKIKPQPSSKKLEGTEEEEESRAIKRNQLFPPTTFPIVLSAMRTFDTKVSVHVGRYMA